MFFKTLTSVIAANVVDIYPGAFHDFDVPTAKAGTAYFGHRLEYNEAATKESTKDVDDFLRKELGSSPGQANGEHKGLVLAQPS